ncbi:winged helix-turn-helix domain-containing protein [Streptomyces sp. TP-A0874]|uniref:winged helix-turn-helix domain-containing protein n=1 Tax=Streptomyces sp. TP-A0874 TaxID=549819 RepID=UPI000852D931|nr:helix-turn-helix domain-containing protein [Streptomyces sp. TP-A0874]
MPSESEGAGRTDGDGPDVVTLDAKGLRALAHPVRVQLVGLLRTYGPSTATLLAARLGLNSGATSYHLRQLAEAGFVAEETGRGNARERWWRSVHESTEFDDQELMEREPEAALAYLRSIVAAHTLRAQKAVDEFLTMSTAWRHAGDMSDVALRLTPDEAVSLREELLSVVRRYRADTPSETAAAPEEAERVMVILQVLPELGVPAPTDPEAAE